MSVRGPNMSYCMCENTSAALNQVMDAMNEASEDGREGADRFISELNSYERDAYTHLLVQCREFIELANELNELASEKVLDGM